MKKITTALAALALLTSTTTQAAADFNQNPYAAYETMILNFDQTFVEEKEEVKETPRNTLNSFDLEQIKCLTDNAYYEARGESLQGQIAVHNVVMNRVEDSRFPSTPCEVVKQRNRRGCQFSWVCTLKRYVIGEQQLYNRLEELSKQVYLEKIADNTKGAKFYHATYVKPRWSYSMQKTVKIGSHIFYKG